MTRSTGMRILSATIVSLWLLSATGCAMPVRDLIRDRTVTVETVASHWAIVTSVSVGQWATGVECAGILRRRSFTRGLIPGHVDVNLIAPDGVIVRTISVPLQKRRATSGMVYFRATLDIQPPPGSTVRVTHHVSADHSPGEQT